ncbi:MAG: 1-acyl-sn-glycerol-3-phosphate acyltransferase [Candidatus Lokiarchaeota archaeon]|nr:1-acyl-sn-glycerol-3-phosphate acyltransferase [Candidatus Lokiarchaeota archaeon]
MEESIPVSEEKDKLDTKALATDAFYAAVKGIGGLFLKAFTNLNIEGDENIPIRGKAILTTVSKNIMRDMLVISQLSGRKVHFMLDPKLMKHQIAGPVLKALGMIRGTESKEDTEPIDKVFEILNEKGDLVAMTPEAKLDREIQIKSMAAIIKFAVVGEAPIIPVAIFTEKTKILNMFTGDGLKVKVGTPLKVEKRLTREKYRSERYELAEDIINIIDSLVEHPETEQNEN